MKSSLQSVKLLESFYYYINCILWDYMHSHCVFYWILNYILFFSLSKLRQLQDLDLHFNELTAETITVIGEMTSLRKLNVRSSPYFLCLLHGLPRRWDYKLIMARYLDVWLYSNILKLVNIKYAKSLFSCQV